MSRQYRFNYLLRGCLCLWLMVFIGAPRFLWAKKVLPVVLMVKANDAASERSAAIVEYLLSELMAQDSNIKFVPLNTLLHDPAEAPAGSTLQKTLGLKKQARQAYEAFRLDDVKNYVEFAKTQYKQNAAYMKDANTLAELLLLRAATFILQGENIAAQQYIYEALSLQPSIDPDPRIFNPSMRQFFLKLKNNNHPASTTMQFHVQPSYSQVYLDGNFMGFSPMQVQNVPVGLHVLRVEKPGFAPWGELLMLEEQGLHVDGVSLKNTEKLLDHQQRQEQSHQQTSRGLKKQTLLPEPLQDIVKWGKIGAILWVRVALNGDRVQIEAVLWPTSVAEPWLVATYVWNHQVDWRSYEEEVRNFYQKNFSTQMSIEHFLLDQQNNQALAARSFKEVGMCFGGRLSCPVMKWTGVGLSGAVGLTGMVVGLVSWSQAASYHRQWQGLDQIAALSSNLKTSGQKAALTGDIFFPLGAAFGLGATAMALWWHPNPDLPQKLSQYHEALTPWQTSPQWQVMVDPLQGSMQLQVMTSF